MKTRGCWPESRPCIAARTARSHLRSHWPLAPPPTDTDPLHTPPSAPSHLQGRPRCPPPPPSPHAFTETEDLFLDLWALSEYLAVLGSLSLCSWIYNQSLLYGSANPCYWLRANGDRKKAGLCHIKPTPTVRMNALCHRNPTYYVFKVLSWNQSTLSDILLDSNRQQTYQTRLIINLV